MKRREFIGAVALASSSCVLPQRAVTLERGDFGIARRRQETALRRLLIVDEDNRRINVSGHTGKILMLVLWEQRCPVCRAELKRLTRLQEEVGADRLRIVLVSMFEGWERDRAFAKERRLPFAVYAYRPADDATVAAAWLGIRQSDGVALRLPTTALFLPDGRLADSVVGPTPWTARELEQMAGLEPRPQAR